MSDQRGKLVLVTFLYTNCPDVCPLITQNLNQALQMLGPKRDDVRVLAVSVDPAGDTPESVDKYAKAHHLLPEFDAAENVEMPMRIARMPRDEAKRRAAELLGRVGLGERLAHRPGMLSGGEQQRVAVARALVMNPALLLADEPTGDLDETTADALHQLLRDMHAEHGLTSIIATHNPRLAAACDRVLRMEHGQLVPA